VGAELTAPLVYGRGRKGGSPEGGLPFWRGVERHAKGREQSWWGLVAHVESLHARMLFVSLMVNGSILR